MNTIDHQEHQVDIQEKRTSTFFFQFTQKAEALVSWCIDHKRLASALIVTFLGMIVLGVYGMEKSKQKSLYATVKAEALVQELRQPMGHAGEQEKKTPAYEEIEKTLLASSEIRDRFNGVLLEEAIIFQKPFQKNLLKNMPSPLQDGLWLQVSEVAEYLEKKEYETALSSIQTLLQTIHKKNKEQLYTELLGYLHIMEDQCLKVLHRPNNESSIELEKWKSKNPELAHYFYYLMQRNENIL